MKKIANPYAVLFAEIFELNTAVTVYSKRKIKHPSEGYECEALMYPVGYNKGQKKHVIILSKKYTSTLSGYLNCLAHEYVHAWQDENGYNTNHGEKSQFKPWARYLKERFGLLI